MDWKKIVLVYLVIGILYAAVTFVRADQSFIEMQMQSETAIWVLLGVLSKIFIWPVELIVEIYQQATGVSI